MAVCGAARWANCLHNTQRPSEVRQQLQQAHMPVAEAPSDDDVRPSYNFAPGYHGLVYRAHDSGLVDGGQVEKAPAKGSEEATAATYKLQSMQWGRS